jgi:hypothetical protein
MGTTLTGKTIKDTYDGLIKTDDNQPLNASTVKRLNDGLGNPSPIYLSQDAVEIDNGSFKIGGELVDGTDSSGTSGQLLSSTATGVQWISGGGLTNIESVTHHNFNNVDSKVDVYVPINTTSETSSRSMENYIIPIYNGDIARVVLMTSNSATGCRFYMYNGTSSIGSSNSFNTTANTATVVSLNSVGGFSQGDRINFRLTAEDPVGDVQISILWQYTRP